MIGAGIIEAGLKILDKVIPDPTAKADAQYRLLQLQQSGELAALEADTKAALAQADVDKVEAGSSDPFVRRWRPAVGWVCVGGLVWQFLACPLLTWLSSVFGVSPPPAIQTGDLITLLVGMLGLGGLRTAEKIKGVA